MLTREEIEAQRELWNKGPDYFPESRAWKNELCDLALVGLSVQEGVKDAREVAGAIVAASRLGPLDDKSVQQLIAAFALKQGGEPIAGFDSHGCIVSKGLVAFKCDPGASWLLDTWAENNKNAKVHVTITASKPLEEGQA